MQLFLQFFKISLKLPKEKQYETQINGPRLDHGQRH